MHHIRALTTLQPVFVFGLLCLGACQSPASSDPQTAPANAPTLANSETRDVRLPAALPYQAQGHALDTKMAALPAHIDLLARIGGLHARDQYVRRQLQVLQTGVAAEDLKAAMPFVYGYMFSLDQQNTAALRDILKIYSWEDLAALDRVAVDQAFYLVQHSGDPDLMAEALAAFEPLAVQGRVDAASFAKLFDRVAGQNGRAQRYGTQRLCRNGVWQPQNIEDPARLEARRASVGLEPQREYDAGAPC